MQEISKYLKKPIDKVGNKCYHKPMKHIGFKKREKPTWAQTGTAAGCSSTTADFDVAAGAAANKQGKQPGRGISCDAGGVCRYIRSI